MTSSVKSGCEFQNTPFVCNQGYCQYAVVCQLYAFASSLCQLHDLHNFHTFRDFTTFRDFVFEERAEGRLS